MSIISDIQGIFADTDSSITNFYLSAYPNPSLDTQLNIYGVDDLEVVQQNQVANKPIEAPQNSTSGTGYTSDSVQIKPYTVTIRGVIYPEDISEIADYVDIGQWITQQIAQIRIWQNNTQLFSLSNTYSFGTYEPLKIESFSQRNNAELTIPEIVITFKQVQVTNADTYTNTSNSSSGTQDQAQNNNTVAGN